MFDILYYAHIDPVDHHLEKNGIRSHGIFRIPQDRSSDGRHDKPCTLHCSIQQRIGLPHLGMDSLSTSRHTTTSPSSSRQPQLKLPWLDQTLQSPVRPPSLTNRYTRRPADTSPAASAVRSRTRCSAVSPARCNNGSIQTNFAKRRTSRTGSMFLDSWLKCSCC